MSLETNPPPPPPITDAHVHLWDLQRLHMPWIGPPLNRNFLIGDYMRAAAGLNVTHGVYVEVGVGASQRYDETEIVVEICQRSDNPLAGLIMGGNVGYGDFHRYLAGSQPGKWIKGVRQGIPEELKPTSAFVRGVRQVGALGLVFELNGDISRSARLVELCPETRFVVDHYGGMTFEMLRDAGAVDDWKRDIDRISRNERVACKLSGIISTAPADQWKAEDFAGATRHLIDAFGPSRLMFASDWPICTLGGSMSQWVAGLRRLLAHLPEADQSAIFHDTAIEWYGLEPSCK